MPNTFVPTGTSGTIQIYDDGSTLIQFLIRYREAAFSGDKVSFPWAYTANGARTSWYNYELNDQGYESLGVVYVDKSQTVVFHLGESSSPKLGGPLDHSFYVSRSDTQGVASITVNNIVRRAIPYVNVNGVWKQAEPYVKIAGEWRQTT